MSSTRGVVMNRGGRGLASWVSIRRWLGWWGVAWWAGAGLLGSGVGCRRQAETPPTVAPVVVVAEVVATNVPLTFEFIGQLDSPRNIEVRARVEGYVDKILFTEGKEVKEGDALFELDKRPFIQRLKAAEGALAEARAALGKYEKDVSRLRPLAEQRAIPRQDLENAEASVDVGEASVRTAEAAVESARLDLSYCDLTAPGNGLIGVSEVAVGDLVGKGQPTLLATLSQLDPIWFYCSISEVDYLQAERKAQATGRRMGDLPLTLVLADGSEHTGSGTWVFRDRAVDTATGTLRARAQFPNPDRLLRPGMFARVRMSVPIGAASILVPQRAVVELQGSHFVWVVGEGNLSTQRAVKTGARIGSSWVIEHGLQAGERIIVEGVQKAREGKPVQPSAGGVQQGANRSAPADRE